MGFDKKYEVILIIILLYAMIQFSLTAFRILNLCLMNKQTKKFAFGFQ